MRELPSTWATTTLEKISISIRNGISEKPSGVRGQPILRISAVRPFALDLDEVRYLPKSPDSYAEYALQEGDLLFTRYNGSRSLVGVCSVVPRLASQLVFPDKLIRVRVDRAIVEPKYLHYAVNVGVSRTHIESRARTTAGQTGISGADLRSMPLILPPVAEQRRIVAAIEEHLSDLDAAVAGLERARANTRRYRDAVRTAAVAGTLLGDGSDPSIRNPNAPPNALPVGWRWMTVAACAAREPRSITDGPFGSNLKTAHYTQAGPRVVRLQNVGDGEFVDVRAHISQEHFETLRKHEVFAGDVVLAALGETLPRACIVPESLGPAIVKADCIRFRPDARVLLPAFANIALNADSTRKRVTAMVHGVGRPRLNLSEVKSISLPLPSLEEQRRIVAEVESRIAVADRTAAEIDVQLARAKRLRRSILQRAFEGRLVPQDPTDEPASMLIERIRAVEAPPAKPASRRTRRPSI